jgi:small conductance mechanosensitive channel
MRQFIESIVTRLQSIFNPDTMADQLAAWFLNLIVGLLVFVAFYFFWRILRLVLKSTLRRRVDATAFSFIETMAKFGLLTFAAVTALDAMGIKTSAVLASLGILGLTIGFAARDALSNLISGILIFIDRPFVIGDLVEIEGVYGRVDRITLRSTRVVTNDGRMLAVPNTQIINKTVASYTNFPHLRLDVAVTVAVTENLERARQVMIGLVQNDAAYMKEPPPRVVVTQLNDYNVVLELQAWLDDERQHIQKRFELREKIFNALNAAGVVMPFETIQVTPLELTVTNGSLALPAAAASRS